MADALDLFYTNTLDLNSQQLAANAETDAPDIDPITQSIRNNVILEQTAIIHNAIESDDSLDEEEREAVRNMGLEEFDAYLRDERNKQKINAIISEPDVQKRLNEVEVEGYQKVYSSFPESFKNMSWEVDSDQGSRSTEIKGPNGNVIANLTETTHNTEPVNVTLHDGSTKAINSYRTVDFPTKLDNEGPLHLSMAVKDSNGKNISAEKALYFTAHYDKQGNLTEISSPQPIKFAGEGDNAIGYIERNGEIYTLAVTQGQYKAMSQEVAKNNGRNFDLSQQVETLAPDIAIAQQQGFSSPQIEPNQQEGKQQTSTEKDSDAQFEENKASTGQQKPQTKTEDNQKTTTQWKPAKPTNLANKSEEQDKPEPEQKKPEPEQKETDSEKKTTTQWKSAKPADLANKPEEQDKPEPEQKKPEPEQKKPEPEQKKPEPEQKKPEPEQKKPEPEQKKPEPEQKKPEPEQKKPEPEQKKPEPEQKETDSEKKTTSQWKSAKPADLANKPEEQDKPEPEQKKPEPEQKETDSEKKTTTQWKSAKPSVAFSDPLREQDKGMMNKSEEQEQKQTQSQTPPKAEQKHEQEKSQIPTPPPLPNGPKQDEPNKTQTPPKVEQKQEQEKSQIPTPPPLPNGPKQDEPNKTQTPPKVEQKQEQEKSQIPTPPPLPNGPKQDEPNKTQTPPKAEQKQEQEKSQIPTPPPLPNGPKQDEPNKTQTPPKAEQKKEQEKSQIPTPPPLPNGPKQDEPNKTQTPPKAEQKQEQQGDLFAEIRKGKQLRKPKTTDTPNSDKKKEAQKSSGLQGVLESGLDKRKKALNPQGDDTKSPYEGLKVNEAVEQLTKDIMTGDPAIVENALKHIADDWDLGDPDTGLKEKHFKEAYDSAMEQAKDQVPDKKTNIQKAAAEIRDKAGISDADRYEGLNVNEAVEQLTKDIMTGDPAIVKNALKHITANKNLSNPDTGLKTEHFKEAYDNAMKQAKDQVPDKKTNIQKAAAEIRDKAGISDADRYEGLKVNEAVEKLTKDIMTGDSAIVENALKHITANKNLSNPDTGLKTEHFKKAYDNAMEQANDQVPGKKANIQKAAAEIRDKAGISDDAHIQKVKENSKPEKGLNR